jgi:hypothetical protein
MKKNRFFIFGRRRVPACLACGGSSRTHSEISSVASGLCPDKFVENPCISGHRPDATAFFNGILQKSLSGFAPFASNLSAPSFKFPAARPDGELTPGRQINFLTNPIPAHTGQKMKSTIDLGCDGTAVGRLANPASSLPSGCGAPVFENQPHPHYRLYRAMSGYVNLCQSPLPRGRTVQPFNAL